MKKMQPLLSHACFLLITGVSALSWSTGQAQTSDQPLAKKIVAEVNGRPITENAIDNVSRQISAEGQEVDAQRILEELINMELLTQAAEEMNLDAEPEISATLQLQYAQTMANAYLARKSAQMSFTDEELRTEYDSLSANADVSEFRASHILLDTDEQAASVLLELEAGKPFANAATEHSIDPGSENGGDLGWFTGNSMVPEFAAAVAKMEIGEVSDKPVQSKFGFHIINLTDKRDAPIPNFDSVKSELTNLAVRRALADHVEQLKAAASIDIRQ